LRKTTLVLFIAVFFLFGLSTLSTVRAQENLGSNLFQMYGASGGCTNEAIPAGSSVTAVSPIVTEDNPSNKGIFGVSASGLSNIILGCSYATTGTTGATSSSNYYGGGILGSVGGFAGSFYANPPASLAYQISNTITNISPVQSANAQVNLGSSLTGYGILQMIASAHSTVVSIVYVFYIFIFAVIAFAIMFRAKLGGQQYVTIVNAIPRIIVSLILVVFSYSIAGLIIDVSNIGLNVVYNIFVNSVDINVGTVKAPIMKKASDAFKTDPTFLSQLGPFSNKMSVFQIFGFSQATVFDSQNGVGVNFVPINFGAGDANRIVDSITNTIMTVASVSVNGATGANAFLVLLLAVAAITSMFKLFFALLKDFITLIFYPILAPIQFALVAIPGQEKSAFNWFKTMLGSSLSFVAVYAVFVLIVYLGHGFLSTSANQWVPPLLGFSSTPSISFISSLAAYGLFIISPGVPDMVKGMLNIDASVNKFGSQIAETTRKAASTVTFGLIK